MIALSLAFMLVPQALAAESNAVLCGNWCLARILNLYNKPSDIFIKESEQFPLFTLKDLKVKAAALGLNSEGVKIESIKQLRENKGPSIIHVKDSHYWVARYLESEKWLVYDPNGREEIMEELAINSVMSGYALVFPGELPQSEPEIISVNPNKIDLGQFVSGDIIPFSITISNFGEKDIKVLRSDVSCGCIEILSKPEYIRGKSTGKITGTVAPKKSTDMLSEEIIVQLNVHNKPILRVPVIGVNKQDPSRNVILSKAYLGAYMTNQRIVAARKAALPLVLNNLKILSCGSTDSEMKVEASAQDGSISFEITRAPYERIGTSLSLVSCDCADDNGPLRIKVPVFTTSVNRQKSLLPYISFGAVKKGEIGFGIIQFPFKPEETKIIDVTWNESPNDKRGKITVGDKNNTDVSLEFTAKDLGAYDGKLVLESDSGGKIVKTEVPFFAFVYEN